MQNSSIEWTDHTFNPWWGCMKVSEGCKNCYAETLDNRYYHEKPHWGPGSTRKSQSESYWKQPLKWNVEAEKAGAQAKVFCASMADVFEGHPDTLPHITRLFLLIEQTPWLIWQLLTKRPENIMKLVPVWWVDVGFPKNVWLGTSVENQKAADERIHYLLQVPAEVRFLSCEPLLGPVDLEEYITLTEGNRSDIDEADERGWGYDPYSGGFVGEGEGDSLYAPRSGLHWVIAGGESGPGARPMHPEWVRSLRNQCEEAYVPFFFKQWGAWAPRHSKDYYTEKDPLQCLKANGELSWWAGEEEFTVNYSSNFEQSDVPIEKVGKKAAGALLDGKEYKQFPNACNTND